MLKRIKLGVLIEKKKAHSQTGPFGTQLKASDYADFGIPVINVRNIGFGDVRTDSLEFVDKAMAKELKNHVLQTNDIVFGRKGAVERHSLISSNEIGWIQGSDCIRLRFLTEDFDPVFISYFFRTEYHKQWMMNLGSFGATMASLNQEIISKIEIPDIPIQVQNKIAFILSSYDELINTNLQMTKLLEATGEEIYNEWFVRMRFPKKETSQNVKADLDTHQPKKSDVLPQGWEFKHIDQFSSFILLNNSLKKFVGTKNYIATADVKGIYLTGKGEKISWDDKPSRAQLAPEINTVFFARMSNTYKVLVFAKANEELIDDLALSSGFFGLKAKNDKFLPYLFWFIKSNTFHSIKDAYSNGTTQVSLTNEGFRKIKLIEPSDEVIELFGELTSSILDQIIILNKKNQILQQTRDSLLPRLMSGKLNIECLLRVEDFLLN